MPLRRETLAFAAALAILVAGVLHESILGGKVLSPADVVFVEASFREFQGPDYEPKNRLLMDPVLQFEPWLELSRAMLRRGRLPLWNGLAGCGAPLLANGQSAVFDPFHAIAYLGTLPGALAWIAAARLWVAGMGMFLLARRWGLGAWGRWFAGLAFPLCGFLIAWLLFPSASVAAWMPWLFLATDRVLDRPGLRTVAGLAAVSGCVLLGGQVQVGAHLFLAAAAYAGWRTVGGTLRPPLPPGEGWGEGSSPGASATALTPARSRGERGPEGGLRPRALVAWAVGMGLGVALAAIEVVPLGFYLTRSPIWTDRAREKPSAWSLERPRLLDAACTAMPYAFGSQRRGMPNLARGLGVQNLNEAAGGFAGLATLIWLAPLGWSARRANPRAGFLGGLVAFGAMGAFGVPPVANLLRAVPVLDVTDNRRLGLWVAFGLVLLGGIGLDRLGATGRGRGRGGWAGAWAVAAVGLLLIAGAWGPLAGPRLRARAIQHYARAAAEAPGADPMVYRARAERQVRQALRFVPAYCGLAAAQLLALAALATALRRGRLPLRVARGSALGLVMIDLLGFGVGLNPAIDPAEYRPESAVIAYLRREVPPPARVVAVGAELPPNLLMRYGLADLRNYDSIELAGSLAWFAPLYEPEPGRVERTSRRAITWAGVIRARDRLARAGVAAIVGASPPPPGAFARVDRVGATWIARPETPEMGRNRPDHGRIAVDLPTGPTRSRITIAETYEPGWRAEVDGRPAAVGADRGAFLTVATPPGARRVVLRYDPPEVRIAAGISAAALAAIGLAGAAGFAAGRLRSARPRPG